MPLPLPVSLSPSKVASFKDCALAFRFSAIDRVPEPSTVWAAKGTLVHRALELLYLEAPGDRTVAAALDKLAVAVPEILEGHEYQDLVLTDEEREQFLVDADRLVRNAFVLEDPTKIRPIGLELRMQAKLGSLTLRGIIDRLELDEHGDLIVSDYKTGKVPGVNQEQSRLGGVQFYAFLCEQMLGKRPAKVQLLYLHEPMAIISSPTEQSLRGLTMRTSAIWTAVEKACARDDFRPKPSGLCNYCSYKAWCPAFGGDPGQAPSRRFEHLPEDTALINDVLLVNDVLGSVAAKAPTDTIDLRGAALPVVLDMPNAMVDPLVDATVDAEPVVVV